MSQHTVLVQTKRRWIRVLDHLWKYHDAIIYFSKLANLTPVGYRESVKSYLNNTKKGRRRSDGVPSKWLLCSIATLDTRQLFQRQGSQIANTTTGPTNAAAQSQTQVCLLSNDIHSFHVCHFYASLTWTWRIATRIQIVYDTFISGSRRHICHCPNVKFILEFWAGGHCLIVSKICVCLYHMHSTYDIYIIYIYICQKIIICHFCYYITRMNVSYSIRAGAAILQAGKKYLRRTVVKCT